MLFWTHHLIKKEAFSSLKKLDNPTLEDNRNVSEEKLASPHDMYSDFGEKAQTCYIEVNPQYQYL